MYLLRSFNQLLIKKQSVKLYSVCVIQNKIFENKKPNITSQPILTSPLLQQNRNFSLQAAIESIVKTQTGIFKSISESTAVSYVQNFIVDVHSITGLPWWASIMFTTILLRTCITFPLAIHQNLIMAKLENLKLELPAIAQDMKKELAIAIRKFQWDEKRAKSVYMRSVSMRF